MTILSYYKSRLRPKGQITLPSEIRALLRVEEGDDLVFLVDEQGRVVISPTQIIPPDQAWFWTERWQRMERQAQEDIEAGRVKSYKDATETLAYLSGIKADKDAED
jgi:antitoxin MazE